MNKKNNNGLVIWLTGLPCSGKTTLAKEIEKYFIKREMPVQRLDGDVVRETINKDLSYNKADRDKNIERVAHAIQKISDDGINVVSAFVSPYQRMRDFTRSLCKNYVEIYVKCSIEECMRRDTKGMYKKAINGEIKDFTGVQDPFEIPQNPDIVVDTENETVEENFKKIIEYIEKTSVIDVDEVIKIVRDAGAIVMRFYDVEYSIEEKENKSPVTDADMASHDFLVKKLSKYGYPVLSEEGDHNFMQRKNSKYVWIIDPLDGTMEFIKKTKEFSLMIGLADKEGESIFGIVYAPALDELYFAQKGGGAYMTKNDQKVKLHVSDKGIKNGKILVSRNHLGEFEQKFARKNNMQQVPMGSAGLKICRIARGDAELYINSSDKSGMWDICAADVILKEAGGKLTDMNEKKIFHNVENVFLMEGYVVSNNCFDIHNKLSDE
ncbi:MAG: adenylyl-sulfate kinase [Parcubacteria group bacterium]|jgi:3'(2'),5'-bisphosphate nucleotidase